MAKIEFRTLLTGERARFAELLSIAFSPAEGEIIVRYLDHDPQLSERDTLVAVDGNRLVGSVQIFNRTIQLAGETIPLGGIGSVATHPEHERRGIATELLRRAIDEMTARGMALSLLFTDRISFYQRLGWIQIPHPVWVVKRSKHVSSTDIGRPYQPSDLPRIKEIYHAYAADRPTTTRRDAAYWEAQLAFAGNPDEDFRVVEEVDTVAAYARRIEFSKLARVIEYARADGAAAELAQLLVDMTPAERPLFVPACGDGELAAELGQRAKSIDTVVFAETMWRIVDRPRLTKLSGLSADASDADLLHGLVSSPRSVFWLSDRF
jgi:predicted N-acetyltransferase YhbS